MGRKSRNQKDVGQKHEARKGQWAEKPETRKTLGKNMKVNGLKSEISERCWKKWNEKSKFEEKKEDCQQWAKNSQSYILM